MMRGEEHKQPQNQTKTNQTRTQKHNQKGQRPNPPRQKVFPLYEGETGETGEKGWLETIYGPGNVTIPVQKSEKQTAPAEAP